MGTWRKQAALASRRHAKNERRSVLTLLACLVVIATAMALMLPAISASRSDLETAGVAGMSNAVEAEAESQDEAEPANEAPANEADPVVASEPEPEPTQPEANQPETPSNNQGSNDNPFGYGPYYGDEDGDEYGGGGGTEEGEYYDPEGDEEYVAPELTYPEQTFYDALKKKDADDNEYIDLAVYVEAPEGALPEGTTMKLERVASEDIQEAIDKAVKEKKGEEATANIMNAVKITFLDMDGFEIQPAKKVSVKLSATEVLQIEKPALARVTEVEVAGQDKLEQFAEIMKKAKLVNWDDEDETTGNENTLQFKAKVFGVFAVMEIIGGTEEDEPDAEGDNEFDADEEATSEEEPVEDEPAEAEVANYPAQQFSEELKDDADKLMLTVNVDAPEGALPEGATMKLTPVTEEEVLDAAKEQAAAETEIDAKRAEAIAVDITFYDANGEVIEPQAEVHVTMSAPAVAKEDELAVVHMPEEQPAEVLEMTAVDAATATAEFDSAKFSVYALVYTVDFHYEVDGQTYDYSIQGGGTLSLKELLQILNVVDADEVQEFTDDIQTVEFSNPELIFVKKVKEDITAGALKEAFALEPEYSSGLTKDERAAMDAKQLVAVDWALVTLKAFDTEEQLTITMANGEVFTIKVTDARDPLGLEGKSYAIVSFKPGTGYEYYDALMDEIDNVRDSRGYYMTGQRVTYVNEDGQEFCDQGVTTWTFEYLDEEVVDGDNVVGGYYRIKSGDQYLWIDPTIETKYQTSDHSLNLVNTPSDGTRLKVTRHSDGSFIISNDRGLRLWNYADTYWLAQDGDNVDSHMHLCTPREQHKADMMSAADLTDGQTVVVYQKVWNETTATYDYYAVDGAGDLVRVYQSGNAVYWLGDPSIEWDLTDLGSGYYELRNAVTGLVLAPQNTGSVHDAINWGINLPGKQEGTYASLIGAWDTGANTTYGFSVDDAGGTMELQVVPYLDSQEFLFASSSEPSGDTLKEVATVDSESLGITIKMFNFSDSDTSNNGTRLQFMNDVLQVNQWAQGVYRPGIVENVLGSNGYPISTSHSSDNDGSLSNIFENADHATPAVYANHLFLQSVYDATGFFKYSAFDNYAHLEDDGDFAVYEQIGSPWASPRPGHEEGTRFPDEGYHDYYARGNFLPYNDLLTTEWRDNAYDPDLNPLPESDPRKGEKLYLVDGHGYYDQYNQSHSDVDYFFGMTMEAKFTQNPGGLAVNGDPMVYEFNGDDDLWVFIDDVLILDLGGVHDAFRGKIDFRTGKVTVRDGVNTISTQGQANGNTTYIMEQFWKAHRYPNGDPWLERDAATEALYFTGPDENGDGLVDTITVNGVEMIAGTFKDYTVHDFAMFYMERGAGASNLDMQFNLPVLTGDQFTIEKQMPSTASGQVIQNKYADAEFYYQAKIIDGQGERYVTRAEFPDLVYDDGTAVVWKTDNMFVIRPGHKVAFPVANSTVQYWAEEVEPEAQSRMLDNYWVTNSDQDTSVTSTVTLNGVEYDQYKKTLTKTVKQRGHVIFTNKPDENHVNELQIVKELEGELIYDAHGELITDENGNGPYFEYRVYLESTDGTMMPYSQGGYYQIDGAASSEGDPHYVYYKPDPRDPTKSIRVTAVVTDNGNGTYSFAYDTYTDGDYSYTPPAETLNEFKYTEHASQNGSIADIRPGDKIVIPGLLEGTDFVVDERTDRTHIASGATEDAGKEGQQYIYEGATAQYAYIRPNINVPTQVVGSMYDPPDYSEISYDQNRAALATILPKSQTEGEDALVTVKNRGDQTFGVELEKRWSGDFDDLGDASVTFTVMRYKLATKSGSVTLNGTLVDKPAGAKPVYKFIKDGVVVKTVPFNSMEPAASDSRSITINDLPVGEYAVVFVDATQGYDYASNPVSATVTVPEDGNATVSITSTYTKQTGYLEILKAMSGDYASDTAFSATYTISGDGLATPLTRTITASDFANSSQAVVDVGPLPIGTYTVTETINATNGRGTHTPESRTVTVVKGGAGDTKPYASFTGDYQMQPITLTVHFGYSPNNGAGWSNGSPATLTYQVNPGSRISVPFLVRNCPHWGAEYHYYASATQLSTSVIGDTNQSAGSVHASTNAGNENYVERPVEFSIPADATEYHIYIRSLCNQSYWAPTMNSAPSEVSLSRAMSIRSTMNMKVAPSLLAAGQALRAAVVTANVEQANPVTIATLPVNDDPSKKYVIDDTWQMQVDMTASTYSQRIGTKAEGATQYTWETVKDGASYTGNPAVPWKQLLKHSSVVAKDANGDLYLYYIASISETDVPNGTTPTFGMDESDATKTLVTTKDDPHTLWVINNLTNAEIDIIKQDSETGNSIGGSVFSLMSDSVYIDASTLSMSKLDPTSSGELVQEVTIGNTPVNCIAVPVGGVRISELPNGTYTLKEVVSPSGYNIGEQGTITFEVSGGKVVSVNGQAVASPSSPHTFNIPNTPGVPLPHTGGFGTLFFTIFGMMLVAIAGGVFLLGRRRPANHVSPSVRRYGRIGGRR